MLHVHECCTVFNNRHNNVALFTNREIARCCMMKSSVLLCGALSDISLKGINEVVVRNGFAWKPLIKKTRKFFRKMKMGKKEQGPGLYTKSRGENGNILWMIIKRSEVRQLRKVFMEAQHCNYSPVFFFLFFLLFFFVL